MNLALIRVADGGIAWRGTAESFWQHMARLEDGGGWIRHWPGTGIAMFTEWTDPEGIRYAIRW